MLQLIKDIIISLKLIVKAGKNKKSNTTET